MIVPILFTSGAIIAICAMCIILAQHYRISQGVIVLDETYNGPAEVKATLLTIIRYGLKRSVYIRKFFMQYALHVAVRVMHYIDIATSYLYAKSRNVFVKNAVRNKGTVPHFWEHLKVYKQEMDKEKEEK